MNFQYRSQVLAFLIAKGFPVNFVKVAVDQGYNYEADNDQRDLCFRGKDEEDFKLNPAATMLDSLEDQQPTFVDEEDALAMYHTFADMLTVEGNNIAVDGEVMYDLEGNLLPMDKDTHNFIPK